MLAGNTVHVQSEQLSLTSSCWLVTSRERSATKMLYSWVLEVCVWRVEGGGRGGGGDGCSYAGKMTGIGMTHPLSIFLLAQFNLNFFTCNTRT